MRKRKAVWLLGEDVPHGEVRVVGVHLMEPAGGEKKIKGCCASSIAVIKEAKR